MGPPSQIAKASEAHFCVPYLRNGALEFIPFPVYPHHGALDPEVVQIAQRNNAVAILTGDKSDFAAKKLYFGLLLRAGVSAAVIREYHLEVTSPELQLARVTPHLQRMANELRSATEPLQITFRKGRMQVRGLQEIIEEMEQ